MKTTLMNTEMTKAILDGHKVQTRRVITNKLMCNADTCKSDSNYVYVEDAYGDSHHILEFAKYKKGDILWVREPATVWALTNNRDLHFSYKADGVSMTKPLPDRFYDENNNTPKWTDGNENGRGIPNGCIKEMARIFLRVTNVRVERLQDITYEDILREGYKYTDKEYNAFDWWINLWNKTAPKEYKWKDNPYVFVYEFEKAENGE